MYLVSTHSDHCTKLYGLNHQFSNKGESVEQSSWYRDWYLHGSSKELARLLSNAIPKNIHNVIL